MRMRRNATCTCAAFLAAAWFSSSTAFANSRFPRAQRLVEHPTDPNTLYLAATYGLQITHDRGQTWYHSCETAFSFQAMYQGDPLLMLAGDGTPLVGVGNAITISHDQGCDWKAALQSAPGANQAFSDFTVSPSTGHPIFAASTTYSTTMKPVNQLQKSIDNGATWTVVGMPIPVESITTIDVDPTNPRHIYATGLQDSSGTPGTGVFLSSPDEGMTWTSYSIPGTHIFANPFIAAVHPTDPNKIFVRTDAWKNRDINETPDDALFYSSDGGKTWAEILHPSGPSDDTVGAKLFGFALSPDGSTVLAGFGDPVDGSRVPSDETYFGVFRSSSDGTYKFGNDPTTVTPTIGGGAETPIACITWTKNGIYVCLSSQDKPSTLLFTNNTQFTSFTTMTTLMNVNKTIGVPPSCNGRSMTACNWTVDCDKINACGNTPPDAGSPGTGTGGTDPHGPSSGGCAWRAPGASAVGMTGAGAWIVAMLVARRRRAGRRGQG